MRSVFQPKDSVKTLTEMADDKRISWEDGHISSKQQFIEWYKKKYSDVKQLVKAMNI